MSTPHRPRACVTRVVLAAFAVAVALGASLAPANADTGTQPTVTPIGPSDWPAFGHDAHRSFAGVTSLDATSVRTLAPAWFFPTGDAVTANPIVVGDTVYVGSWDGFFYAIDRVHGTLRWKYQLQAQPAVSPNPGSTEPRDPTTDGGLVTGSAWFEPGTRRLTGSGRPDLVIFAGGYTLYALIATGPDAGHLFWAHDYTGLPEQPPSPTTDSTRIFSSPVVAHGRVIVGVSADGEDGHRGYVVAADLETGNQLWRFETDVDSAGNVLNDGCGSVWSSAAYDEVRNLVVVDTSDCHDLAPPPYAERVIALHAANGAPAWVFTPPRLANVPSGQEPACDFDFGATANLGTPDPVTGAPTFLGVGGKDGTYYRIDPGTGQLVLQRNVVFGATGLGDIGFCTPDDPRDLPVQDPSFHAFDATTGTVAWQANASQAPGATTVAAGMTFVGNIATPVIQIRDAATGLPVNVLTLPSSCFCAIAVAGNGVFFGTGSPQQGAGNGVYAYTPLASPPRA